MPTLDQPLTPGTVWQVCPVHPTTPRRDALPRDGQVAWCPACGYDKEERDA